jgi:hypothetical protein
MEFEQFFDNILNGRKILKQVMKSMGFFDFGRFVWHASRKDFAKELLAEDKQAEDLKQDDIVRLHWFLVQLDNEANETCISRRDFKPGVDRVWQSKKRQNRSQ